ncbi:MAG: hypothetical protein ACYCS8_04095 [Acidithiobacillus sp.]
MSASLGNVALTNFTTIVGSPNGTLAGTIKDKAFDTVHNVLYICVQTGTAQTAIWDAVQAAIDTFEEF